MLSGSRPYALSIAGFDPSAGAGVLADVKTFENNGVYGFAVPSALTWQNDLEFDKVEWIDSNKIISQVQVLLRRFEVHHIKIGLVESMHVLNEIVTFLKNVIDNPVIVYDPILKASAGFTFHQSANGHFIDTLQGLNCITPNLPEAQQMFGAEDLHATLTGFSYDIGILLKGGHSNESMASDILFSKGNTYTYSNKRLTHGEKHGSGCVLSAALMAQLALGKPLPEAADVANKYTYAFLASNDTLLGCHNSVQL